MVIEVPVEGDLSRFLNNSLYAESVTLSLGHETVSERKTYRCSALILAQRSSVLENCICFGEKEVILDKNLFSLSDHRGISDVIKIFYGGSVNLTVDNFATIMKFSAKYQVEDVFDKCYDWVNEHLTTRNVILWFDLGAIIEECSGIIRLSTLMKDFLRQNVNDVISQMAVEVRSENLNPYLVLEACRQSRHASSNIFDVLIQWTQKSDANKLFVLKHLPTIPFQSICPEKESLKRLMRVLEEGDVYAELVNEGIRNIQLKCSFDEDIMPVHIKKEVHENIGDDAVQDCVQYSHFSVLPAPLSRVRSLFKELTTYDLEDLKSAQYDLGINDYYFVETCLAWLKCTHEKMLDTYTLDQLSEKVYETCALEKNKNVNYSYFLRVLHQLRHMYGFFLNVVPTRYQWPKDKRDDDRVISIAREDLTMLGKGKPVVFDITWMQIGDPRLCKKFKCQQDGFGPHVLAIQLNAEPPLLKPQEEIELTVFSRIGHVHTDFIEHCYGVTRTYSGKEEIVSMYTNTREEFVKKMSMRWRRFVVFAFISKCWGCSDKKTCAYRHD